MQAVLTYERSSSFHTKDRKCLNIISGIEKGF